MRLSSVGIIVAIALRRALLEFVSNEEACAIALKWPNDLIVCGGVQEGSIDDATTGSADASSTFRKISGISIEQVSGAICVGIGVNVNQPAGLRGASDSPEAQGLDFGRKAKVDTTHKFEGDKRNAAAYLADLAGNELDCKVIATQILDELALAYSQWVDCGFAPFVAEYKANCAFKGQSVKVELDDGSAVEQGKVEGIDNYGRLIVNGTPITSGSIHAL
jgi:BirA family biotin operon repressor/biotin-[acetyl-CoA-carboxylase] ligase